MSKSGFALFACLVCAAALGGAADVESALKRLKDSDWKVRVATARELGEMRDAAGVDALMGALQDDYGAVRAAAAESLGKMNDARAVDPLLHLLNDAQSAGRPEAARALGALRDPRAVEALASALTARQADLRQAAAEALGAIADPRAVEPLANCLKDRIAAVRAAAAEAMRKIGQPAIAVLRAKLKDDDRNVRAAAAQLLGDLGDKQAAAPLIACLKDRQAPVRARAAEALGKLADPQAVDPLIACLGDRDADVRARAAEALGKLADPRAAEALAASLKDRYAAVRDAAALALSRMPDARAAEALVASMKGRSGGRAAGEKLVESLVKMGEPAVPALLACLKDGDELLRYRAVQALGEIGDPRAVAPLAACLDDRTFRARNSAAVALGKIGKPALAVLISKLRDEEDFVRRCVAEALADIADAQALEPLIAGLADRDEDVRAAAARGLGNIRDPRAVPPLMARLTDDRPLVRCAAAKALGAIADPRAINVLAACLSDRDVEVRRQAADALAKYPKEQTADVIAGSRVVALRVTVAPYATPRLGKATWPTAKDVQRDLQTSLAAVYESCGFTIEKPDGAKAGVRCTLKLTLVPQFEDYVENKAPPWTLEKKLSGPTLRYATGARLDGELSLDCALGSASIRLHADGDPPSAVVIPADEGAIFTTPINNSFDEVSLWKQALGQIADRWGEGPVVAASAKWKRDIPRYPFEADVRNALSQILASIVMKSNSTAAALALAAFTDGAALFQLRSPSDEVKKSLQEQARNFPNPEAVFFRNLTSDETRQAVAALVHALRLRAAAPAEQASIFSALRHMTGQDFGEDAAAWEQWWARISRGPGSGGAPTVPGRHRQIGPPGHPATPSSRPTR